jgi:hypothetical protein
MRPPFKDGGCDNVLPDKGYCTPQERMIDEWWRGGLKKLEQETPGVPLHQGESHMTPLRTEPGALQ